LIRIGALPPKHGLSGQAHLPEIFGDALLPAAVRGLGSSEGGLFLLHFYFLLRCTKGGIDWTIDAKRELYSLAWLGLDLIAAESAIFASRKIK
jgi:hypothetical protein